MEDGAGADRKGGERAGRPRSEAARLAVLHAVDDLLLEVGYVSMTMKGIADRAGVSRATVYRWWSSKSEILFEASVLDAAKELAIEVSPDPVGDLIAYVGALVRFMTSSPAGIAYRVLLGQDDPAVARLLSTTDVLGAAARPVVERVLAARPEVDEATVDQATAQLIGPVFFWIVTGRDPARLVPDELVAAFLRSAHGTVSGVQRGSS